LANSANFLEKTPQFFQQHKLKINKLTQTHFDTQPIKLRGMGDHTKITRDASALLS
jgi:hypothetical protein